MDGASDPARGMSLRLPPANARAEMALLGALLVNNKALGRCEEFLRAEHFADPVHGRIYAAIVGRVARGRVADGVSLMQEFAHDAAFAEVGGSGYLAQLTAAMVGITVIGEYARAIRDAWMRRELIEACGAAIEEAFGAAREGDDAGPAADCPMVLEALDARLLRIAEGAGDETPLVQAGDALRAALDDGFAASKRATALAGVTTGYAALDRMTAGLCKGDYILLGARPSMGKTSLGLGIATRAAMAGAQVLFWSGEMAAAKLGARAAAAYCGLSTTSVFTGRDWAVPPDVPGGPAPPLVQADWDRLVEAERAARTLGLHIDVRPGVTPQGLRARARRMKRKGGLDLVVLDYIGLMRASSGKPRNLYEKLTEISAELVMLKQELGVPLLVMAQLSRANEARDDKMPTMSDLRDSGALEQDADVIMLLHRPHYYLSRSEPQRRGNEADEAFHDRLARHEAQVQAEAGRAQVNVVKNRNGATGVTRLLFHDRTTWFRDEGEGPDAPAWGGRLEPPPPD